MPKCLVIGAGINGVLTGFELLQSGFDVDILDAGAQVGIRATFANGCQLSFSHTTPMNISPSIFSQTFHRPLFLDSDTKNWLKLHHKSQTLFEQKFHTLMEQSSLSKIAFDQIFKSHPNLPHGTGHSSGTAFIFSNSKQFK